MTTAANCPFLPPGYDFTDPDVLVEGIPVGEFAQLRKTAPVWWNEQTDTIFDDGGYWVITRHADIKDISRNSGQWSTNRKGAVMRLPDGVTASWNVRVSVISRTSFLIDHPSATKRPAR